MQQPKSMLECAGRGEAGAGATRGSRNSFSVGESRGEELPPGVGAPGMLWFPVGIFPGLQVKHEQMLLFDQGFLPPSCKCFCCKLPSQTRQPFRERNATCKMRKKQQVKPKPNSF